MDEFIISLLLILVPILIIGTPILLTIWIYKILRKKRGNPRWRILAFLPIFIVGYLVYDTFYPSTELYKEDFKEVTGIELPKNSEFQYKNASYPDIHGDYTSVSVIKTKTVFYDNLQSNIIKNGLIENEATIGSKQMDNAKKSIKNLKIDHQYSKEDGSTFYYLAFLSDKETILVQRLSY